MPVLSLPLTFNNSFWSQVALCLLQFSHEYRRGLEAIYGKLVQGIEEDEEVIEFIRARATVERDLAEALISPRSTGSRGHGMDRDDGASLLAAFRGLQAESVKQGEAHQSIANELDNLVADPFEQWSKQHATRIAETKSVLIDSYLKTYEEAVHDVSKLKDHYLDKARKADEVEDDLRYAPNADLRDGYTTPPSPRGPGRQPRRSESISDRISSSLFGRTTPRTASPDRVSSPRSPPIVLHEPDTLSDAGSLPKDDTPPPPPKLDKGKGKEILTPLEPTEPAPPSITLAGVPFPAKTLPELMTRAKSELPLRPIRIPLLGEYEETFTGEDFVTWLKDKVPAFAGSLDRAETAARELTEQHAYLRRIGEFGNKFENHPAATYQFRPKAFETPSTTPTSPDEERLLSPTLVQGTEQLVKRSNTIASYLAKSLRSSNEPPHLKARHAAEDANEKYRTSVRKLDRQRLALEDRIEIALKQWNRWELDRLRAVKTVLLQYQGTISNLPKSLNPSLERSGTLLTSFQPESDLTVAIERYRTGPFRPHAHVYESIRHQRADVVFGLDLRQWAGEGGWHAVRAPGEGEQQQGDAIPLVVKSLLAGLDEGYKRLPDDNERRKAWIYDVPLPAQHTLREALNSIPIDKPIPVDLLAKQDVPVIASTLKLWLLELDPSLATWEAWDEVRKLYPNVGADNAKGSNVVEDLKLALKRLPKVHLLVLDAIVKHLTDLIAATPNSKDDNEVYITKLALSVGRCILRPQYETSLSIQDRHSTVFFIDLLTNYASVLPPAIAAKKRDSERTTPMRKRTAPVDMRLNRSRMSQNIDPQELLAVQKEMQTGVPIHRAASPGPGTGDRTPRRLSVVGGAPPQQVQAGSAGATGPPPPPRATGTPPAALANKAPAGGDSNGMPPRPHFVEPPPETDDEADISSSVVIIPPSPIDAAHAKRPEEPTTPKPSAPSPAPTTLADTRSTGEPIRAAAVSAGADVASATPGPPPPLPPAPAPAAQTSPPVRTTSPPAINSSGRNTPTSGGRVTPSGRQTPTGSTGSGRVTPTKTTARRSMSPPVRKVSASDPPTRAPSVSSSLRRESSVSSTGSVGSGVGTPTGTANRVGGPRIVRGPRVAHRPMPSLPTNAVPGSAGGSGSGSASPATPGSAGGPKPINPALKRRPLSGIGFAARTMASESEGEKE